jgi:hypothetical protein
MGTLPALWGKQRIAQKADLTANVNFFARPARVFCDRSQRSVTPGFRSVSAVHYET